MLRPVGSQPPSVYWRRRLMLLAAAAAVLVLVIVTVSAMAGGTGSAQADRTPSSPAVRPTPTTSVQVSTGGTPKTTAPSTRAGSSSAPVTTDGGPASAAPKACTSAGLAVSAVVGKRDYQVGDKPLVELQVTNTGSAPCVQDMSDKQIELRVYNGTSRVWGSHDCAIQPGTDYRTLAVGQPYKAGVEWGGLTSAIGCKQSVRQQVGAGSYTLYASLSGHTGTAAQFTIG